MWEKKNIHLAQKGPERGDEDICSQVAMAESY